uniref:Uncharacterized protein n=1 Tax=Panagrolaimus sp. JU765 TaxID=591449 RepID=A0AC34PWF6_9BILA
MDEAYQCYDLSAQTALLRKRMVQSGLLRVSTRNVGSEYRLLIPRNDSKRKSRNDFTSMPDPTFFFKKKFPPTNRKHLNEGFVNNLKRLTSLKKCKIKK